MSQMTNRDLEARSVSTRLRSISKIMREAKITLVELLKNEELQDILEIFRIDSGEKQNMSGFRILRYRMLLYNKSRIIFRFNATTEEDDFDTTTDKFKLSLTQFRIKIVGAELNQEWKITTVNDIEELAELLEWKSQKDQIISATKEEMLIGTGTEQNPKRTVIRYHDLQRKFLAEYDPYEYPIKEKKVYRAGTVNELRITRNLITGNLILTLDDTELRYVKQFNIEGLVTGQSNTSSSGIDQPELLVRLPVDIKGAEWDLMFPFTQQYT